MNILHSPVANIIEKGPQPSADQLSKDELLLCFPGAVEFVASRDRVRLPDVALFGLLYEATGMWAELCAGRSNPSRTDRYGAYKLSVRISTPGTVLLEQEWSGDEISVLPGAFHEALVTWSEVLFSSALRVHPTLTKSAHFAALKAQIAEQLSRRLAEAKL